MNKQMEFRNGIIIEKKAVPKRRKAIKKHTNELPLSKINADFLQVSESETRAFKAAIPLPAALLSIIVEFLGHRFQRLMERRNFDLAAKQFSTIQQEIKTSEELFNHPRLQSTYLASVLTSYSIDPKTNLISHQWRVVYELVHHKIKAVSLQISEQSEDLEETNRIVDSIQELERAITSDEVFAKYVSYWRDNVVYDYCSYVYLAKLFCREKYSTERLKKFERLGHCHKLGFYILIGYIQLQDVYSFTEAINCKRYFHMFANVLYDPGKFFTLLSISFQQNGDLTIMKTLLQFVGADVQRPTNFPKLNIVNALSSPLVLEDSYYQYPDVKIYRREYDSNANIAIVILVRAINNSKRSEREIQKLMSLFADDREPRSYLNILERTLDLPNTHFLKFYQDRTRFDYDLKRRMKAKVPIHLCQLTFLVEKKILTIEEVTVMMDGQEYAVDTLQYLYRNGLSTIGVENIVRYDSGYSNLKTMLECKFITSKCRYMSSTVIRERILRLMAQHIFQFSNGPALVDFYDLTIEFYEDWSLADEGEIQQLFLNQIGIDPRMYYEIVSEFRINDWLERYQKRRKMITRICVYIEFCRFPRIGHCV